MPGKIIVVVGAVGGVGASTVAAMAAAGLVRRGRSVALVDGDPGHGGIEVLLGAEGQMGARWPDLSGVRAVIDVADLAGVLPRWRGVDVLSADRRGGAEPAAAEAVLDSLVEAREVVVVDLPGRVLVPSPEPFATGLVESASEVVVVTGQDVLGVGGALMIREAVGRRASLVLRRRRHARVAPAEAAAVLGLRLLALLPSDRRLAEAVDVGLGPLPSGWRHARVIARLSHGLDGG